MIALLFFFVILASAANAAAIADLEGTWSTKSLKVTTGPSFYDFSEDKLLEPSLPGISYSFTTSGHYEEAYYRAISNPKDPTCPKGILQWQHGTFTMNDHGSLFLTPYAMDGRQLLSDPCGHRYGHYTRYNQTEHFKSFSISIDRFQSVKRLQLISFDGSLMQPMYLVDKSPKMLPTTTLDSKPSTAAKSKRYYAEEAAPFVSIKTLVKTQDVANLDRWLWIGVAMSSIGGVVLLCS